VRQDQRTYDFDVSFLSEFNFMDAYKAEGLLSLCVHLVKVVQYVLALLLTSKAVVVAVDVREIL
jgi:hypothetical protein